MSVPWQSAQGARGLLLVSGDPARVAGWVRRGLVACQVVPLGRWSALVPAEPGSRAKPPYDDAVAVLAARPVPARLRPALGFYEVEDRAVVTVSPRGWRSGQRWLVWRPGTGVGRLQDLEPARIADLVGAAGRTARPAEVSRVLGDPAGTVAQVLDNLMTALDLPALDLWRGTVDHDRQGEVVEPTDRAVQRFDARLAEEARHRAEMEGQT